MIKRLLKQLLIWLLFFLLLSIYIIKRPAFNISIRNEVEVNVQLHELEKHVKYLSHDLNNRSYDIGDGLNLASNYIESQMKLHHEQVSFQPYQVNGIDFQNVIATHGPTAAHSNDFSILVVGAHYDAYGGLPGADDNASGVAGLLELNRILADEVKSGLTLDKQIMLVAYTLEEPPIYASNGMGSVIHAESLKKQEVELMISLEMIGYFNDGIGTQSYPIGALGLLYPDTGHFITVVDELFSTAGAKLKKTFNRQGLIEAYSINAPTAIPGVDFSDHRSYWALDIPAIMVTDTAFYRNQNYHTENDTYNTLNYQRMSYVVSGVLEHLKLLAKE